MTRVVKIEQTSDGRWAVVQESMDGTRKVIRTYPSVEEAKIAAESSGVLPCANRDAP